MKFLYVYVSLLLSCENSYGYWVLIELGYKMVYVLFLFFFFVGVWFVVVGVEVWGVVVWVFEFIFLIMVCSLDIWK